MASRTLNVVITGDTKQFSRAMGTVERETGKVDGRVSRFSNTAKVAFATAGIAAGGVLVAGLMDSVRAAKEAEVSQAKLEAQLKALGISYRAHAQEIDRVIQKTSQLSGLDDEDLQDAFTNIIRVTGDVDQSLRLTGLAADFARAKHLDVAKAGEIVGKVAGGNIGILSRYGIQIQKGATATQALGILQQKFSGQAAAYGRTAAGANDRFRVAVENLEEKLGKALLPMLTRVTNRVATFVNQITDGTGAGGRFARRIDQIVDALKPLVRGLAAVAGAIASVVRWLSRASANITLFIEDVVHGTHQTGSFGATLHSVAGTIGSFIRVVVKVGGAISKGITAPLNLAASAANALRDAIGWIIDHAPKIPHIKLPSLPKIHIGSAGRAPAPGFPQLLAESDVAVAQTDTTIRGQHILPDAYVTVLQARSTLLQKHLRAVRVKQRKIRAKLRAPLTKAARQKLAAQLTTLTQEEASVVAEINSIASTVVDVKDEATQQTGGDTGTDTGDGGGAALGDAGGTSADSGTTAEQQALIDAENARAEADRQLQEAILALKDEMAKGHAQTEAILRSNWQTAIKALADTLSGQIAGYGGYAGRAATAGAGSTYRL